MSTAGVLASVVAAALVVIIAVVDGLLAGYC